MTDVGELLDLRLDKTYLYVSDNGQQLYILDAQTFALVQTLPVGGHLTLDGVGERLYVAPDIYSGDSIAVIDTATHTIIGTLPGHHIAVDSRGKRLFVGTTVVPTAMSNRSASACMMPTRLKYAGKYPKREYLFTIRYVGSCSSLPIRSISQTP